MDHKDNGQVECVRRESADGGEIIGLSLESPVTCAAKPAPKGGDCRLAALRRFAIAISILNVLGYTYFGFEPPYAQPFIALGVAYSTELFLEMLSAWTNGRKPQFAGGIIPFINFLLPSHITGLACSMLLYSQSEFLYIVFAVVVAIGSKWVFRVPVGKGVRHFLNPSNTGIAVTLLLFPKVGIAAPYMFTENLHHGRWILPLIIICSGSFLNARYTFRIPLILSWLGGFVAQALLRTVLFDANFAAALNPMTGVAFLLFTFYMVTDPATTPARWRGQVAFGLSVALAYGLLVVFGRTFGLFFALAAVCSIRGLWLMTTAALKSTQTPSAQPAPSSLALATVQN